MKKNFLAIAIFALFPILVFGSPATIQLQKNKVKNTLIYQYHFKKTEINNLFSQTKPNFSLIQSMEKPMEKGSWTKYRDFFITPTRIQNGVNYWRKHRAMLSKMQRQYGVSASVAVSIIGIETAYGTHLGKYPVFNTLYTLAFYYPKQAHFFQQELIQYLLLTRSNHLPITTLKGSYAGAIGIPQFMPSSYRHYGVPGGNYRSVNLFTNNNDAIASIGNYLHLAGWQRSRIVAERMPLRASFKESYVSTDRKLNVKPLKQFGLERILKQPGNIKVAIVALPTSTDFHYWVVFPNFRAIMQYNHSVAYAMAVTQLSQAIQKKYLREYG